MHECMSGIGVAPTNTSWQLGKLQLPTPYSQRWRKEFSDERDSSEEGAKIGLAGDYKWKKSPEKIIFHRGLAWPDGGYSLLALP